MTSPETYSAPDKDAEYWAIRLDGDAMTAADQVEMEDWLAGEDSRAGALLRAQAALAYLDRGRALHDRTETGRVSSPGVWTRRGVLMAAGGAMAAACAGAFVMVGRGRSYATRLGEVRQVALSDGSSATINTDSRISVDFQPHSRRIALTSGEAWFAVAHDRSRPFVVEAGQVRVRAVGTAFSVRRRNGSAEVLVTEGVVETWVEGHEGQKVRVAAGSRARVTDGDGGVVTTADAPRIARALSWRDGQLALDGETVDFAIAEMNRYNSKQIVVDSPRLGREPLVGYFRINEPEKFSSAVAALNNGRAIDDGSTIHLVSVD